MRDKYTLLKQELSIPQEAKIHGITWRWVDKQKKKKYPALVYEIQGKTKTKHIPKRLYHLLDTLDTQTNLNTGLDTNSDTSLNKEAFFKLVEGMTKHLNFDDKIELLKIALEAILEKDQLNWEEINRTKAMIKIFWSILKDQAKNLHKKESIK